MARRLWNELGGGIRSGVGGKHGKGGSKEDPSELADLVEIGNVSVEDM